MFIVMLPRNLNEKKELGFIFIDEANVIDRAVSEVSSIIGHAMPAPPLLVLVCGTLGG